ncbi:substrate-binding domain-containing protein [Demequina sp. TTPB684]|uniref:substrate-binding domain-containing protein n=1 Tax=unclassified Demequina TaxID=2620311 RepID=UPI001CF1CA68|nr:MULTISPECIES: substrate-binding domain-containing protein [unclassified Demequina]MCB2412869.1 substrate-binding domain-containing protein [Demequina sp. TTPB684]UPU88154.1 substrate-binding domain-containing protein [Demequina sp. TMPB413]
MNRLTKRHSGRQLLWKGAAVASAAALALTGCSSEGTNDSTSTGGSDTPADGDIGVSLILKTTTNPFFVAMQEGAEEAAAAEGVNLTVAAGREDGDEDTQIQAIENAISRGDAGILITPSGQAVEEALIKAREAGLYVIALDTPPSSEEAVDITFATDNFLAGELIGEWAASELDGEDAVIAMLDLFDDKIVSVDYARDQGFLTGMGIDVADPQVNGDEAKTGSYSGGNYTIVGNEATQGAEDGGRTAMELLLAQNPDINVVYTINEPAAYGAKAALDAAGKSDVLIVSVDGGCAGVEGVASGVIGATSQQYPLKMAELGVTAIAELVRTGTTPDVTAGLDFFNTGVALVTDSPADGVESIDTAAGSAICWG